MTKSVYRILNNDNLGTVFYAVLKHKGSTATVKEIKEILIKGTRCSADRTINEYVNRLIARKCLKTIEYKIKTRKSKKTRESKKVTVNFEIVADLFIEKSDKIRIGYSIEDQPKDQIKTYIRNLIIDYGDVIFSGGVEKMLTQSQILKYGAAKTFSKKSYTIKASDQIFTELYYFFQMLSPAFNFTNKINQTDLTQIITGIQYTIQKHKTDVKLSEISELDNIRSYNDIRDEIKRHKFEKTKEFIILFQIYSFLSYRLLNIHASHDPILNLSRLFEYGTKEKNRFFMIEKVMIDWNKKLNFNQQLHDECLILEQAYSFAIDRERIEYDDFVKTWTNLQNVGHIRQIANHYDIISKLFSEMSELIEKGQNEAAYQKKKEIDAEVANEELDVFGVGI